MADKKISALTSLAQGDVAVTTDVLPIVDTSATETKKVTAAALVGAGLAAGVTSVDINSGSIDGTTIGANSAAAGTFTNLTASGTVSFSGATVSNGGSVTTVDINGGTIDGATIATSDITVGSGKTLNVSAGTLTLADNQISGDKVEGGTINAITINTLTSTAVNATTVDATNVEVTNVKAKDGTAAATIADSTGVVSITANPILSGGTANGVLYLNGSKVATSGTGLTFNGANLGVATGTDPATITLRHTGNTSGFILKNFSGSEAQLVNADNGPMVFKTNDTEFIRLTAGGNVGIGTSSPAFKLDVNGSTGIRITGMAGVTNSAIYIPTGGVLGDNAGTFEVRNGGGTSSELRLSSRGFHTFFTGGSGDLGTGTERMRLTTSTLYTDSSINVGIGTSSPGAKTEIFQTSTTTPSLRLRYNSTSVYADHLMNGNGDYIISAPAANGVTSGRLTAQAGKDFAVFTNGASTVTTPQLSVDSSGNLGLGVTPSAWQSTRRALQVGGSGALWASATGAGTLFLSNNTYFDGSNFVYLNTSSASYLAQQTDGAFTFNQAASGTAGNAISFTQAMTLDSGGRLLIGRTTSDANNYRIQISQGTATYGSGIQFVYEGAGAAAIWENSSGALCFGNDGADGDTQRATITSGGFFKASNTGTYAGSTSAYHELRSDQQDQNIVLIRNTNATSPYGIDVTFTAATPNNTTNTFITSTDSTNDKFIVYSSGTVTNRTGTYNAFSDLKLKQDVVDAGSQWNDIKALRVRKFRLKDEVAANPNYPAYIGLIAQEAEQVSPGLVEECADFERVEVVDEDGNVTYERKPAGTTTKSVKYSILYMKAVKALQEAMARIEKLEAEMAALKGA